VKEKPGKGYILTERFGWFPISGPRPALMNQQGHHLVQVDSRLVDGSVLLRARTRSADASGAMTTRMQHRGFRQMQAFISEDGSHVFDFDLFAVVSKRVRRRQIDECPLLLWRCTGFTRIREVVNDHVPELLIRFLFDDNLNQRS